MLVDLDVARRLFRGANPQERPYMAALGSIFSFGGSLRHGDGCCLLILPPAFPKLSGGDMYHPGGPSRCHRTVLLEYIIAHNDFEDWMRPYVRVMDGPKDLFRPRRSWN